MENLLFNTLVYASILLVLVSLVFIVAQAKSDNSIMDIVYGPLFFFSSLFTLIYTSSFNTTSLLLLLAIGIWSVRLSWRIYRKNKGKPEDIRYANWRQDWLKQGRAYFLIRSYLQINILQGIVILFVSLPFIISLGQTDNLSWLLAAGLLVFGIGLTIESVADYQLDKFIKRKIAGTEQANLMTTGLFHYSRRPNYFGESLIWWGLAISVLSLPLGYLAILSPITITYIVTKVTGPMLEKIFIEKHGEEYLAYMRRTSYFIPLPPKA
jgi:steroid 5-alpha reductase family enzyme